MPKPCGTSPKFNNKALIQSNGIPVAFYLRLHGGDFINSQEYWRLREEEALKHRITDEKEYDKEIKRIYGNMLDACQNEINAFYGKYAAAEGITLAEAKKRVSQHDVKAFERKAQKYVAEKNFSKKANDELRLYNATMKINRLEMLKANIGLETIAGHDELEKFMAGILQGRTEDELARQAGILGKTIQNNAKKAHAIVNGSFHNGTFSDRIWQYQDLMRENLGTLLQTGLIQGKNPRALTKDLKKYWYGNDPRTGGGAVYCMERLMRTELARVQTEAQKQSFERNGFEEYEFIVNGGCCSVCEALRGKHFKVAKMMPGENAPPMHPHCRCSTAAYEDSDEYEAWLDHLANGGTTEEWNEKGRSEWLKSLTGNAKSDKITPEKSTQATPSFVDGQDLSGKIDYTNSEFEHDIETAVHAQGFDGLPKVVNYEEFKKAMEQSSFYAERTYGAPTKEMLEEWQNELYNGKWYIDCSTGGSQYGRGMYCAAAYQDGKYVASGKGIDWEMSHYQELGVKRGNKYFATEAITLQPGAKIFTLPNGVKAAEYISDQYRNNWLLTHSTGAEYTAVQKYIAACKAIDAAYDAGNYDILDTLYADRDTISAGISESLFKDALANTRYYATPESKYPKMKDPGTLVAEMGYDAINAEGHGESGSYTVILNRSKVIFCEGGSIYGNNYE